MRISRILLIAALAISAGRATAWSQTWAVSSNIAGAANYGTLNVEGSMALGKHWNISAGAKYNPFSFSKDGEDGALRKMQRSISAGARYWPWHVYSGWWIASKLQYQEYNFAGFDSPGSTEGDRFGALLGAGYSYMLSKWLNVELGFGFWGGYDSFRSYDCPTCGVTTEKGRRFFLKGEDIILALCIIF